MTRKGSVSWPASGNILVRRGIDVLLLTELWRACTGAWLLCQVHFPWSTSFRPRCIIGSLIILILGKCTILNLSLISYKTWKWALFALFSIISLRFPRRPRFSWLVLLLLGTFLLFRILLLLLLRYQRGWLVEWRPYVCDLNFVVGRFLLNLHSMIERPLELGLLLESWVSLSYWSLYVELGGSLQWVNGSLFACERTHWCREVEMFRASWRCLISHV